MTPQKPPFQFGLGTLLLAVSVACILFAMPARTSLPLAFVIGLLALAWLIAVLVPPDWR